METPSGRTTVIPLVSPGRETLLYAEESFYTTLRVRAGSHPLPKNLLRREGNRAASPPHSNPGTQAAHSEFTAPEEAAEGVCLGGWSG